MRAEEGERMTWKGGQDSIEMMKEEVEENVFGISFCFSDLLSFSSSLTPSYFLLSFSFVFGVKDRKEKNSQEKRKTRIVINWSRGYTRSFASFLLYLFPLVIDSFSIFSVHFKDCLFFFLVFSFDFALLFSTSARSSVSSFFFFFSFFIFFDLLMFCCFSIFVLVLTEKRDENKTEKGLRRLNSRCTWYTLCSLSLVTYEREGEDEAKHRERERENYVSDDDGKKTGKWWFCHWCLPSGQNENKFLMIWHDWTRQSFEMSMSSFPSSSSWSSSLFRDPHASCCLLLLLPFLSILTVFFCWRPLGLSLSCFSLCFSLQYESCLSYHPFDECRKI